jgi:type III restriction enzyme
MELKRFQHDVIKDVDDYLRVVAAERAAGNVGHSASDAWRKEARRRDDLKPYQERRNGLDEELPHFCIKVPTGGGKTLLATQMLGSIHRLLLTDRRGAGLVLWVVPSSQIYRDTLKRLSDRRDLYRVMLEHALSRRIEVWEKHEITRLTPARLRECLNILIVQLASTNRETKEQLKFFRDSGGNIVQHFPPEDDYEAHQRLKEQFPNMEMLVENPASGHYLAKTSIGNLVRLCRPVVVVDEGHKATSQKAQETIEGFNASFLVELSATPHKGANILSRVSGQQLLDEEMIKLPLNIATSGMSDWKALLTRARDKRQALQKKADDALAAGDVGQRIRPIVLIQVERTGKEQRGAKSGGRLLVHSEDVLEYLKQRLSVADVAIRVKTAENDGLEDVDVMDPDCPVEWIITKSALQEGWDCPYAYILVSLNNTGSAQAMTQLVGRVLRQPFQERLPEAYADLNESYIYCLHQSAGDIAKQVKSALEKEGYEGDLSGVVTNAADGKAERTSREIRIRPQYRSLYGRDFEGEIYLPRFCVKDGRNAVALDYFEHLIRQVRVDDFEYSKIEWDLMQTIKEAKDRYYSMTLGSDIVRQREADIDLWERDEQVLAWLTASLRFDYLSFKQLRRIVHAVYERLIAFHLSGMVKDQLALVKTEIRKRIEEFVQGEVDRQTEAAFNALFDAERIVFYLQCKECRFAIPESIEVKSLGELTPLTHENGSPMERSLFDFIEREGKNEYERKIALCLDKHADVLWWFRNRVGPEHFAVQGYKRQKMYPDYVVQKNFEGRRFHHVLVIESKGAHLEGNPDTTYKRNVAKYFSQVGRQVSWQQLGADFKDHVFRFQILDEAQTHGSDWSDALKEALTAEK